MSTETYEIIELSNGDVALRRAGHKGEPLVRIHFSDESQHFLREHKVAVARAMLEAGIEAVQDINEMEPEPFEEEDVDLTEHTIH
ncbi:hypothetical protein [Microbulbifer sp. HZ11]|uniref:hypothetical protein n=1 Tax=unclassified Microbulbifer TaxID=2619833 RepID=UPI0005BE3236|nr:hypothetical protein [Microbulbifer sp. HZ11]